MKMPAPQASPIPFQSLVKGLGWFSIGLGLAELVAPRALAKSAGMRREDGLIRGYGLREIATGIGLLTSRQSGPWLWGRVAGDVLDVATVAASGRRKMPYRRGGSLAALLGVGLVDLYCAMASAAPDSRDSRGRRRSALRG